MGISEPMIYLYAITNRQENSPPLGAGIADAVPYWVSYRDLAALVSVTPGKEAPPANEANLWRHEQVIEQLMAHLTVLPVRFGTVIHTEDAIRAALEEHYATFVADLKRLQGCVELSVRVIWNDAPPPVPENPQHLPIGATSEGKRDGRSYMLARMAEEQRQGVWRQRAKALIDEIHPPLAAIAVENTYKMLVTPRMLLTAAYLVDHAHIAAFQHQAETLSTDYPALQFLCTGPWPAYNFVSTQKPTL